MSDVSVIVPWRPDGGHRDAAWAWVRDRWATTHPGWRVIVGPCPDGPWSKGTAIAAALARSRAPIVVIADADVWCEETAAAVETVARGHARWAMPHTGVHRLTAAATATVLAGGPLGGDLDERHRGVLGGGIVALARDVAEGVPIDPRFAGWGQEDTAWALALTTLVGRPWRGTAPLWHLWHPPAPRESRTAGSPASIAHHQRYRAAAGNPTAMRALLAEFCPHPLEDVFVAYTYRNSNTGDVVVRDRPDVRLERLRNWVRIGEPEPPTPKPTPAPAPPPSRPAPTAPAVGDRAEAPTTTVEPPAPSPITVPAVEHLQPGTPVVDVGLPPFGPEDAPIESAPPAPPARSAPKATWVAHAVACGMAEADAKALTKTELIAKTGGTS